MRVEGAVALVTGGSSGIGAATAHRLADAGAKVLVTGRDPERVGAVAAAVRGVPIVADLVDPAGPEQLARRALAEAGGRIDILVNNAGIGAAGPFAATVPDLIGELIQVNLTAPLRLTLALLPRMRPPAALVFVTSIAGRLGVRDEAAYAAVKAGLDVFAGSLRQELAGTGVSVSVVVPGVVDTPFFSRRGTPYRRGRPRPVPAGRVAAAALAAVRSGRAETYIPAWLRLPVAVRSVAPGAYRALAGRLG